MARYVVNRLLQAIPALIGVTVISFVLLHIVPGSPVHVMLGSRYTADRAAILSRQLGLNKPLWDQYVLWLGHVLAGNLGYSYIYHEPVATLIWQYLPHTIELVVVAVLLAHLFAIILGAIQAYFSDTIFDRIVTVLNYFFYSMPAFWLGIIVIQIFAIALGWFPSGGIVNVTADNPGIGDYLYHLVLPAFTLMVISLAQWARYMRSSMRETLIQDYIRTARAKGASEKRVLFIHALRNSVLPLITLFGLSLPSLFAGALFIEEIFNYPGMGLLYWNAANDLDYPVLLAIIVFLGIITIVGNLISDMLYAIVDPRIQYN